jgi:tankyrase
MAASGRRSLGCHEADDGFSLQSINDPNRELFEACRNGDINKVKKLVTASNVNAKDTAGRKSSPLHFAAGQFLIIHTSRLESDYY